jgi:hypothetical protein
VPPQERPVSVYCRRFARHQLPLYRGIPCLRIGSEVPALKSLRLLSPQRFANSVSAQKRRCGVTATNVVHREVRVPPEDRLDEQPSSRFRLSKQRKVSPSKTDRIPLQRGFGTLMNSFTSVCVSERSAQHQRYAPEYLHHTKAFEQARAQSKTGSGTASPDNSTMREMKTLGSGVDTKRKQNLYALCCLAALQTVSDACYSGRGVVRPACDTCPYTRIIALAWTCARYDATGRIFFCFTERFHGSGIPDCGMRIGIRKMRENAAFYVQVP